MAKYAIPSTKKGVLLIVCPEARCASTLETGRPLLCREIMFVYLFVTRIVLNT